MSSAAILKWTKRGIVLPEDALAHIGSFAMEAEYEQIKLLESGKRNVSLSVRMIAG